MAMVTGIVYCSLNGSTMRVKDGTAKLDFGGFENTPQFSGGKVAGCAQKAVPGRFTATLIHMADTDVLGYAGVAEGNLVFETDSGKKYQLINCYTSKPPELSAGEGELSLELIGDAVIEG
jgi:hypothetical protein